MALEKFTLSFFLFIQICVRLMTAPCRHKGIEEDPKRAWEAVTSIASDLLCAVAFLRWRNGWNRNDTCPAGELEVQRVVSDEVYHCTIADVDSTEVV